METSQDNMEEQFVDCGKPISKKALVECIRAQYATNSHARIVDLANLVNQAEFGSIRVSSPFVHIMKVELSHNEDVPLYDHYCGHSLQKAVEKLKELKKIDYVPEMEFPSTVHIKEYAA